MSIPLVMSPAAIAGMPVGHGRLKSAIIPCYELSSLDMMMVGRFHQVGMRTGGKLVGAMAHKDMAEDGKIAFGKYSIAHQTVKRHQSNYLSLWNKAMNATNRRPLKILPTSEPPVIDQLLTTEEVAALLKKSVGGVRMMQKRGQLPSVRLGRLVRFKESTIARYIAGLLEG